jgi:glycosyltransferase involved in cell wall biosynthesis
MMDAVAYGLPVICSDHPGNTTFVKNDINGLAVDHPDVEKLAQAILFFINNFDRLAQMGSQSRIIAEEHSWKNIAIGYKAIINKVLGC